MRTNERIFPSTDVLSSVRRKILDSQFNWENMLNMISAVRDMHYILWNEWAMATSFTTMTVRCLNLLSEADVCTKKRTSYKNENKSAWQNWPTWAQQTLVPHLGVWWRWWMLIGWQLSQMLCRCSRSHLSTDIRDRVRLSTAL